MHHDGVHAIGHREGLEMALDGDGQRELVDEVHGGAGDNGPTAEVLQAEHCTWGSDRGGGKGQVRLRGLERAALDTHHSTPAASVLAGDIGFQPPWPFWQLGWDGAQAEGQGSTQPGPLWVSSKRAGLEAAPFPLWGRVHSTASQH